MMETKEAIGSGQNGKIHKKHRCNQLYAKKDQEGRLRWYRKDNNQAEGTVLLWDILDDDWEIYCEIKEIRPEKAGEVWQYEGRYLWFTHKSKESSDLIAITCETGRRDISVELNKMNNIIHGEGWNRLFPPVEKETQ